MSIIKTVRSSVCFAAVTALIGVGTGTVSSAEELEFKLVYLPGEAEAVVCETTEQAVLALGEFHEHYVADKRPRPRLAKKKVTAEDGTHTHTCAFRKVSFVPKTPYRGVGLPAADVSWGKGVAHYFVEAAIYSVSEETFERQSDGEGYVLVSGDAFVPVEQATLN